MRISYTPVELLQKIEWEGGVVGAIEYGISWDDIDRTTDLGRELSDAWAALCEAIASPLGRVEDLLESIEE